MQQSMQRIFMEKKTRIKGTWVNIQHVKKTQKKNRKRKIAYSLENNIQACYREKNMFLTIISAF